MGVVLDRSELLLQGQSYSGSGDWLDAANSHDGTPVAAPIFTADGVNSRFTLNGSTQYFTVPDDPGLDVGVGVSFTLMVRTSAVDITPAGNETLVSKKLAHNTSTAGYQIYNRLGPNAHFAQQFSDGAVGDFSTGPNGSDGVVHVVTLVRDVMVDDVSVFMDGIEGAPEVDNTTLSWANALQFRIGRLSNDGQAYAGDIYDVVFWREALSDADIVTAETELNTLIEVPRRVIRSPRYGITRMARR